jgi:MerR family redox-sensitive transcriptional activator SoxR
MDDAALTIGQLAQRVGLNTSAIRYYEREGVLPEPARESGRRRYGPDAVRRLQLLDVAKRAGFTLDEARVLLESADAGEPASGALRELAQRKLPDLDALIARAQAMREWMLAAADCTCPSFDVCALFDGPAEATVTAAERPAANRSSFTSAASTATTALRRAGAAPPRPRPVRPSAGPGGRRRPTGPTAR